LSDLPAAIRTSDVTLLSGCVGFYYLTGAIFNERENCNSNCYKQATVKQVLAGTFADVHLSASSVKHAEQNFV
jgi:hypothetical protein